jgi:subtilisin family serine protease
MHQVDVPADSSAVVLDSLRSNSSVVRVEAEKSRTAEGAPDDSEYASQWSLPTIGWDQAYGTVAPNGSAVVAVLDTGVDASHSDLAGNLVAGASMIDGASATSDPNGHGTAMAGIVAAETGNGAGIAGVGYAGVRVMPITVLGADGTGQDGDIINGVVHAADQGADVILMAFSNPGYSPSLQAAVDYAWSKGAVLVGAVGNDGSSTATFPAGDSGVMGVSNTTQNDTLNSSSNYGADTFIAAPGTGILTTSAGGGYNTITGTSASAAEVAGAAALLKANDPSASNGTIVGRLARNADPAGTTAQTGNGRLNLGRAVTDTATGSVKPAGAAPVGSGGPFVGPYTAAAQFSVALMGQPKNTTNWVAGNVSGWSELDAIPMRLELKDGAGS